MTIEAFCLDANIFVSALDVREKAHSEAVRFLTEIQKRHIPLFEPELILFEVGTVLHRKASQGDLEDSEADSLMEHFFKYPLILQWESVISQRALRLAKSLRAKGMADSYYLALAETKKIPLITMDKDFLQRGKKIYDKIYSLDEGLSLTSQ